MFFFRKCNSFFKSPNLQKTILNLKFKFSANTTLLWLAGNLDFKLRIVFWNIFFWRFGDLKNESNFLKKRHLYIKWVIKFDISSDTNWLFCLFLRCWAIRMLSMWHDYILLPSPLFVNTPKVECKAEKCLHKTWLTKNF